MGRLALGILVLGIMAPDAEATWSLAKMDHDSKTIVVSGASCSFMVYGIANVLPGKGVVIVQAASSAEARAHATEALDKAVPLVELRRQMTDPKRFADHAEQQFALLSFAEWSAPLTYTGDNVSGVSGVKAAPGISVQANTMMNDKVVPAVFAALADKAESDIALAKQALLALKAGSSAGGDKRCGQATASTAFLTVFRASDNASMPYLNLVVYGLDPDTRNAVDSLEEQFERWLRADTNQRSSQVFVAP